MIPQPYAVVNIDGQDRQDAPAVKGVGERHGK